MLSQWLQAHRRSILFLLSLLVIGGLVAAWQMPVALFPHINFPRIVVHLDAGDRTADQTALQVTQPIENAVRSVPGVRNIRSTSSRGEAEISLNFEWGLDMLAAKMQVESAINQALPQLPSGTEFTVAREDPTIFPSVAYTLTSDSLSIGALRDIAKFQVRPVLSAVKGVARVEIMGGSDDEIQISVDPARLNARGLALADVSKAVAAANNVAAVGHMEDHFKLYLVIANNQLHRLDELNGIVLQKGTNGVVRLGDVATAAWGTVPSWTKVTADGREAVIFEVHQQPDGNTVQIAQDVQARLDAMAKQLPAGVRVARWYDESDLVISSAKSVRDAVLIGVVLACVVLLIFLRNIKTTLIAIICVPASLAATVLLLKILHMSFNIMTLGGMAASVGLIIDDAIVMVEHVVRRLRGHTGPHHGVVLKAAAEFTRPLAGSSACTIVIFAPLAFLSGVTGAFFKALSLTMAVSLILSFLISLLAVPLLADHLLNEKDAAQKEGGRVTDWLHRVPLSATDRAKIASGNARRILKL